MVFKKFYLSVIFRVLLLTGNIFLFIYSLLIALHMVSSFILGILIIIQVYLLIQFVNQTNKSLSRFFDSIRYDDFSTTFSSQSKGKGFEQLSIAFNTVLEKFKASRTEKEEHYNYLQTVVQHINIGILCFDRKGNIDMLNMAARRIFKINSIRNIDELKSIKNDLPEVLLKLRAGEKLLLKIFTGDEIKQLSFFSTEFRMRGEDLILVAFHDIHAELEAKEIESWQRLIRVLTHEIMNSITPISSLASTVSDMIIDGSEEKLNMRSLDDEDVENVEKALQTIQKRSQGLLNFVDIYRNLTRIPQPNFRHFKIKEAFDRVEQLMLPKIEKKSIRCTYKIFPDDLKLTADPDLIDQVVINLVLNALDAVSDRTDGGIISLSAFNQNNRTIIEVMDNGKGIKPDIIDKIFMPFFTSKKEGSGIGLSLSRQIMHLHKGSITVKSKVEEGSVFILTF